MPLLADLLICLRFFSRLPIPATAREGELGSAGFARAVAMAPVAGALIAIVPVAVVLASAWLRLPMSLAAPLAIAALAVTTGALHEDALADCADGLGGRSRERKLEIMRDSRIGAFGAVAIAFSFYLRSAALTAALERNEGVAALVLSAALSRAACLLPLVLLPPVRADGLGAATAHPEPRAALVAAALALAVASCAVFAGVEAERATGAVLAAAALASAVCGIAWRQLRGQTGDVAGAAQQAAEIGVLTVFAAG